MMNNYSSSKNSQTLDSNRFYNQLKRNFRSRVGTLLFAALPIASLHAQTAPVPQQVPYTQNFDILNGTAPTLPLGWGGWRLEGPLGTVFTGNATADANYMVGTNNTTAPGIFDMTGKLGFLSSNNQRISPVLAIKTLERKDVKVSYDINVQRVNSNRGLAIKLQYRVGSTGTFTDLDSSLYEYVATGTGVNVGSGVASLMTTRLEVNLPEETWYKDEVQLRWTTARMVNNIGSGDNTSFSIDNVVVDANTPPDLPVPFPYTDNFDTSNWMLIGGTQTNKFHVGTPTNADGVTYDNSKLFISSNGTGAVYNTSSASSSYAYKNVTLPTDVTTARLSFKWMARGETGAFDFGRFYIVPESSPVPTAGTVLDATIPNLIYQATATNSSTAYALYNTGTAYSGPFTTVSHQFLDNFVDLSAYAGQTVRLVFYWRNDTSLGNNPPLVVDDFIFDYTPNCITPDRLSTSNITSNSASVSWFSNATNFEYYYSTSDTAPTAQTSPSGTAVGTTANIASLSPLTTYNVWVRSVCDDNTRTEWSPKLTFTTYQIPATFPYSDDFSTSQWQLINGTQTNKFYVGTPDTANDVNYADGKLFVSNNGTTATYGNTTTRVYSYRDITLPADLSLAKVSFKWLARGESGAYDFGRFFITTTDQNFTAGTDLVSTGTATVPNSIFNGTIDSSIRNASTNLHAYYSNHAYNGAFETPYNATTTSGGHHYYEKDGIDLSAYAGQTVRVVFFWQNDGSGGTSPALVVDDFEFDYASNCLELTNLQADYTHNSVRLSWSGNSDSYTYYISPTNEVPTSGTVVNTNNVIVDNLTPLTTYYWWVKADCDPTNQILPGGSFTTLKTPLNYPLVDNFDTAANWDLVNGSAVNKFYIGTPTNSEITFDNNALFISNNGVSNTYTIASATSAVFAYSDVLLPADASNVQVRFKWAAAGESTYDFGRFFIMPTSYIPTAGADISATQTLPNQIFGSDKLNLTGNTINTFQQQIDLSAYAGKTVRILFYWKNDSSLGTQPPLSVDNFCFADDCTVLATGNVNKDKFIYYPNPVQNELNLRGEQTISSIEVYNLAGQVLNHVKVAQKAYTLNTTKLPAGMYVVKIAFENGTTQSVKIIKK